MRIKKIVEFRLIVSFSLLIVLIVISNYLNFDLMNNVSNIIEYKNINSSAGITFEELSKVKDNYKDVKFTGAREMAVSVTNKYGVSPEKEIKTKIVLTDENYFDLYPFEMLKGGKLDFLSVRNNDKVAVISDIMANSLFKSIDVIGSTLNIENIKYRIVGVYRENKSLLYSAAEDGYERVYIPYTSYSNQNKKDKTFLDTMATRETKYYDEKSINDKLSKVLGDKLTLYKYVNYTVSKNIVLQTIKILYFIIGVIVISFLIKRMVKLICEANLFLKENLKNNYLKATLISNKKQFLIFAGKIVICILAVVVVFNIIKFNLVIEDKYLPSNNIFDVDFYRKAIISNMQLNNANENGIENVYNRYIVIVGNIEKGIFLVEVFAMIEVLINQKILNKLQFNTEYKVQSTEYKEG